MIELADKDIKRHTITALRVFKIETKIKKKKKVQIGNSLVVQWVRTLHFQCWGAGSIPGQGTKILQGTPYSQNKLIK